MWSIVTDRVAWSQYSPRDCLGRASQKWQSILCWLGCKTLTQSTTMHNNNNSRTRRHSVRLLHRSKWLTVIVTLLMFVKQCLLLVKPTSTHPHVSLGSKQSYIQHWASKWQRCEWGGKVCCAQWLCVCVCVSTAERRGSRAFSSKTATSCCDTFWTAWNRKRSRSDISVISCVRRVFRQTIHCFFHSGSEVTCWLCRVSF